jgi:hypothetical protein
LGSTTLGLRMKRHVRATSSLNLTSRTLPTRREQRLTKCESRCRDGCIWTGKNDFSVVDPGQTPGRAGVLSLVTGYSELRNAISCRFSRSVRFI